MEDSIKFIQSRLTTEELLCQLAEECAEFGKAALKLRRVFDGSNPTPVSMDAAYNNLIEECADVFLVLEVMDFLTAENQTLIGYISGSKCERWVKRLKETMYD